jgi:hypothetical protein
LRKSFNAVGTSRHRLDNEPARREQTRGARRLADNPDPVSRRQYSRAPKDSQADRVDGARGGGYRAGMNQEGA